MRKTSHTPGPWVAVETGDAGYAGDSGRFHIEERSTDAQWVIAATVGDVRSIAGEEAANARLIAAAPDMLLCTELLESLCAWLLHAFGPDSPAGKEAAFRAREARAALTKASAKS
jgi:hypothetical protein